jgi:hypothetical protein
MVIDAAVAAANAAHDPERVWRDMVGSGALAAAIGSEPYAMVVGTRVAAALARAGIDTPWLGTVAVGDVARASAAPAAHVGESLLAGESTGVLVDAVAENSPTASTPGLDGRPPRWIATISADRATVLLTEPARESPLATLDEPTAVGGVVARARVRLAAHLGGVVRGALDEAVDHARIRHQFGRPLVAFQSVSFALAEIEARTRALEALVDELAVRLDVGEDRAAEAAGALALAGTFARWATATTLHLHGARGLTASTRASARYLDAATASIALGNPSFLRAEAADALWPATHP